MYFFLYLSPHIRHTASIRGLKPQIALRLSVMFLISDVLCSISLTAPLLLSSLRHILVFLKKVNDRRDFVLLDALCSPFHIIFLLFT